MNLPPLSTQYANARLLGSPGGYLSWLYSSYTFFALGFFTAATVAGSSAEPTSWFLGTRVSAENPANRH